MLGKALDKLFKMYSLEVTLSVRQNNLVRKIQEIDVKKQNKVMGLKYSERNDSRHKKKYYT